MSGPGFSGADAAAVAASQDPFAALREDMICIGHRGAMGYEPENTLRSVSEALRLGAPWIEIDVYCIDGELIVIHDDTLDRTTNGQGPLGAKGFDYLRSLDAGKGEKIPTLDEIFDCVDKNAGINVEIKGQGSAAPLVELISGRLSAGWDPEKILVSSFDHNEILEVKRREPRIRIGALLSDIPADGAAGAEAMRAYAVIPSLRAVNAEFVEDAHSRGLKVLVYTVNELEDLERMHDMGVDGVFSNFPDRVLRFYDEASQVPAEPQA